MENSKRNANEINKEHKIVPRLIRKTQDLRCLKINAVKLFGIDFTIYEIIFSMVTQI